MDVKFIAIFLCFWIRSVFGQSCYHRRGKTGGWIQDMEYAEAAQYLLPLYHELGLTDQKYKEGGGLTLIRPATTYRWMEEEKECPVEVLTHNDFCKVIETLSVTRIFFVGDELTQAQALSLFMLMKLPDLLFVKDDERFERTVPCLSGYSFQIVYIRNDLLTEPTSAASIPRNKKNCGPWNNSNFCFPWSQEYQEFKGRTIMIANSGYHIKTANVYQSTIKGFLQTIQSLERQDDLIFLRNSVPGHPNCQRIDLAPYKLVLNFETSAYSEILPAYNMGTQAMFNHILLAQATNAKFEILDIFPMTILRPDGHFGENSKAEDLPSDDCVHYSLPGPIDWWNHLLYSNLIDLSQL